MSENGMPFYRTQGKDENIGSKGIIANDDVVIIKINCQWDERGGTNTDLLKALIQAILNHPDSFTGEIIVADNGQGRGSLDWGQNNAENRSQSSQKVVNMFSDYHNVSTFLWDIIGENSVGEYSSGDLNDGYVVYEMVDPETGLRPSYPKFRTAFGTYVSFKMGIWDHANKSYSQERLKIINIPVLKTHGGFGVTASVKHYMGVQSQQLSNGHDTISRGGMGTEIVETRVPILNILDAVWVNAVPNEGPRTSYSIATRVNIVAASTDPVALDYWGSKYILLQVALRNENGDVSSMDPDNTAPNSFGDWLRLSMYEIRRAGYQVTVDESNMNIHLTNFDTSNVTSSKYYVNFRPGNTWFLIVLVIIVYLVRKYYFVS
jgi:hypothetical protein